MIEEVISPSKTYYAGDSDLVLGVEGLPLLDILTTKPKIREKKTVNNLLKPTGLSKEPKNPTGFSGLAKKPKGTQEEETDTHHSFYGW